MSERDSLPATAAAALPGLIAGGPTRMASLSGRQAQIDADLQRLRKVALKPAHPAKPADSADGQYVHNPVIFAAVIDRQLRALDLAHKIGQEVYDLERVREYLQRIGQIIATRIGPVDPDVQAAIMEDIRTLNEEFLVGPGDA